MAVQNRPVENIANPAIIEYNNSPEFNDNFCANSQKINRYTGSNYCVPPEETARDQLGKFCKVMENTNLDSIKHYDCYVNTEESSRKKEETSICTNIDEFHKSDCYSAPPGIRSIHSAPNASLPEGLSPGTPGGDTNASLELHASPCHQSPPLSDAPTGELYHPRATSYINHEACLIPSAWDNIIPLDHPDRHFIIDGVTHGFRITNIDHINLEKEEDIWCDNYKSVTDPVVASLIEEQIQEEISNHRYVVVESAPHLVSSLGAVPKKDSDKYRLIHDCSRPIGSALNDFANNNKFSYQTLDSALEIISCDNYLAKIDLASAYRSVRIHPDEHELTGLSWTFEGHSNPTYMIDTRLPFGARLSPFIFNTLTQAVGDIMTARGHKVVIYLDDFLCIADTFQECLDTQTELWNLLRQLGFAINYKKMEGPARSMVFLGIGINTEKMCLYLAQEKIDSLKEDLASFIDRRKVTKRMLQSVAGKLNWACRAIHGGRTFLRNILNLIKTLKFQNHNTRLTGPVKQDINWWLNYLSEFNGMIKIIDNRPCAPVTIDACNHAAGGVYGNSFFHLPWDRWEGASNHHINAKEVLALEPAAFVWGRHWAGKKIYVHSDNTCAVATINKGNSTNAEVLSSLQRVFWLSIKYNFRLHAVYYPGKSNVLADLASRLNEPHAAASLFTLLSNTSISREVTSSTQARGRTIQK